MRCKVSEKSYLTEHALRLKFPEAFNIFVKRWSLMTNKKFPILYLITSVSQLTNHENFDCLDFKLEHCHITFLIFSKIVFDRQRTKELKCLGRMDCFAFPA